MVERSIYKQKLIRIQKLYESSRSEEEVQEEYVCIHRRNDIAAFDYVQLYASIFFAGFELSKESRRARSTRKK